MLVPHHLDPLRKKKLYTTYLRYFFSLAITKILPFPGFLGKSSETKTKNTPFPEKWEYVCGPLMHSSGRGGGAVTSPFPTQPYELHPLGSVPVKEVCSVILDHEEQSCILPERITWRTSTSSSHGLLLCPWAGRFILLIVIMKLKALGPVYTSQTILCTEPASHFIAQCIRDTWSLKVPTIAFIIFGTSLWYYIPQIYSPTVDGPLATRLIGRCRLKMCICLQ